MPTSGSPVRRAGPADTAAIGRLLSGFNREFDEATTPR
jgi:hypothetical protein